MSRTSLKLFLAASACAVSAMGAGSASAAVAKIYGGGATLPATYARQAADCYGQKTNLIERDGTGGTNPISFPVSDFNYTGANAFDCSSQTVNANAQLFYSATGSGRGIEGIYSHDAARYSDTDPDTAGTQLFPSVQYGLSETALGSSQVNVYNNGGVQGVVTVVAPGASPGVGQYANPREKYGRLVQVPFLIAPVTIAFDPVYKKVRQGGGGVTEYTFNLRYPRADGSGGLRLDADTYCKIFNGQITNWNDPALKALNGGKSLKDPDDPTSAASWSVPMQIVGRLDSSGTTSLWTRHIAAVCGGLAGNAYADSTSTLPASLQGPVYDKTQANTTVSEVAGKYVLADGNGGVAKYVDFTQAPGANAGDEVTQGRIAYLGPDYTLPSVTSVGGAAAAYNLVTATLKNSSGAWVAPSGTAARISYGAILPPDSNANGTYDAGSSDVRDRANPQDWVEPASKTSALANPTAAKGYPIVGTSNFLAYNCYASAGSVKVVTGFLQWYNSSGVVTDANLGILAKSGFSALPPAWRTAIKETFVKNGSGLGLNISKAGSGGCTNGEVGG